MTDPVKQREMEAKVSQSQQKITEWQEELKHLKGFIHFVLKYNLSLMFANFRAQWPDGKHAGGLSPDWGHSITGMFLVETLHSHNASLYQGV